MKILHRYQKVPQRASGPGQSIPGKGMLHRAPAGMMLSGDLPWHWRIIKPAAYNSCPRVQLALDFNPSKTSGWTTPCKSWGWILELSKLKVLPRCVWKTGHCIKDSISQMLNLPWWVSVNSRICYLSSFLLFLFKTEISILCLWRYHILEACNLFDAEVLQMEYNVHEGESYFELTHTRLGWGFALEFEIETRMS